MKKLVALIGLLIFGLTACGSEKGEEIKLADEAVLFSVQSGVYEEEFLLEILATNGTVYYTLDGSDPITSETRLKYSDSIQIKDRSEDQNIIAAVDPVLFSGNFSMPNADKNGFVSRMEVPADSAVDKCTTVRAVSEMGQDQYSEVIAATYFIGTPEEHIKGLTESIEAAGQTLAVISITMNYDDLYDNETGIYVKGGIFDESLAAYLEEDGIYDGETARKLDANYKQRGSDWKRDCHMELFEFDAEGSELVLSQNCGIGIQGNYSRSDLQKGLRLVADSDYGDNNFRYAVFGDDLTDANGDVLDKFKNLVLRAGGNCAFTSKFNDTYWQTLVADMNCETLASRPCVVYINGEYFGLYILQEDYDNDYMEDHYGVEKDDVIIYKGDAETYELGYKLDEGDLPEGISNTSYYFEDLITFFRQHRDLTAAEDYAEFSTMVDIESVKDYFLAEVWINNKWDWPGKNWSMWKTKEINDNNEYADGKWRLMFYDMEFGGVSGKGDARTNTIKEDNYKEYGLLDMDTDNPAVLCFAYLMTNEEFRGEYLGELREISTTIFEKERALALLDQFEATYSPLYEQFFERYPGAGTLSDALYGGYASVDCIRGFIEERENYIDGMIDWVENHFDS